MDPQSIREGRFVEERTASKDEKNSRCIVFNVGEEARKLESEIDRPLVFLNSREEETYVGRIIVSEDGSIRGHFYDKNSEIARIMTKYPNPGMIFAIVSVPARPADRPPV